jgi:predicted RecB family nuclease
MWWAMTCSEKQVEASMGEAVTLHLSPFHIHGVGPKYKMKLALSGIETIKDLLDCENLKQLSEESTIPLSLLEKIRLKATSLLYNTVIPIAPFNIPAGDKIYLDIETTLYGRIVWMIGFLANGEFHQLYADNYDEEKDILSTFSTLLERARELQNKSNVNKGTRESILFLFF